jgi:hypothetical protein
MSIRPTLRRLLAAKELFVLPSLLTGEETVRTMFVSTEIMHDVTPPFAANRDGRRLAEFREYLDAFSEGAQLSVAEDPEAKPSDAMLARIHPVRENFWDIRSISPKPGIRAFGGFVGKDEFVCLTWNYRENLDGRWDDEVNRCKAEWKSLFGNEDPLSRNMLDEYLSNFLAV